MIFGRLMTLFSSGGSRQILILPGLDTTTTATKLRFPVLDVPLS